MTGTAAWWGGRGMIQCTELPSAAALRDRPPDEIARQLSDWWARFVAALPDGDFPIPRRPDGRRQSCKVTDGALNKQIIERAGYHVAGRWQYRLTERGTAIRDHCRERLARIDGHGQG